MNRNISDSVLKKIKEENLRQTPRWYFVLKNTIFIFGGVLFAGLGMIAIAILLYSFNHMELREFLWDRPHILPKILWLSLPVAWIFLWIVFIFGGIFFIKNTKKGYKHTLFFWAGIILLAQTFGGVALQNIFKLEKINPEIERKILFNKDIMDRKREIWMRPENGFLAGKIQEEKEEESAFTLEDFNGEEWRIIFEPKETQISPKINIKRGEMVRLSGKIKSDFVFEAERIFPLHRPMRKKGGKREKKGYINLENSIINKDSKKGTREKKELDRE